MILYVNGDSHTAAAEAVNPHAFAEDDPDLFYLGRSPHPANLAVSWGNQLARTIKSTFKCDAESASSNQRIIRTTEKWLGETGYDPREIFMIIQWSTWERQEWLIDDIWYQINASGIDQVPHSHQSRYREYIDNVDWAECTRYWHDTIWQLHLKLQSLDIRHVFFNGNSHFETIPQDCRFDWGPNYIGPYEADLTWNQWLRNHGHDTVAPNSWHFGRQAHAAWARFILSHVAKCKLI